MKLATRTSAVARRAGVWAGLALLGLCFAAPAWAQSCRALDTALVNVERGSDFRQGREAAGHLQQADEAVQAAESRYVRDGCNAAAKRGERLVGACIGLARAVIKTRGTRDAALAQAHRSGAAEARREAILGELTRLRCGERSQAGVEVRRRETLFERLFGRSDDQVESEDGLSARGEEFAGEDGYQTVRTLCVRKEDGYFWPISFSTLVDYAANDRKQCRAQCPGRDVELFYHRNPGEEPAQMISLDGEPYANLPTAFAYRKKFNPALSCRGPVTYGAVALVTEAGGGRRAMVTYADTSFPLPPRDPRRGTAVTAAPVARRADVPWPRRRPAALGEAPRPAIVTQVAADPATRIVVSGGRRVRIVGPDTPYAPTTPVGS